MILSRYNSDRQSVLSCTKRCNSSTLIKKLGYHSSKLANLEPIHEVKEPVKPTVKKEDIDPLDELGVPKVMTNIPNRRNRNHVDLELPDLPPIPKIIDRNIDSLLFSKIQLCNYMCDFTDCDADLTGKMKKLSTLKELVSYFQNSEISSKMSEVIQEEAVKMVVNNVTRPIPNIQSKYLVGSDEPYIIDINWPHLQYIYQILSSLILLFPNQKLFTVEIHRKILSTFHSCDMNERSCLLSFFESYVAAFPEREVSVMKDMAYMLYGYHEKEYPLFCVSPILKFFGNRIKAVYSKDPQQSKIFVDVLGSILTCNHLQSFYQAITQTFRPIFELSKRESNIIINKCIKCWPETSASKQIQMINLISFIVPHMHRKEFQDISSELFSLMAKCTLSQHYKVTEASLQIWSQAELIPFVLDNSRAIFQIMFPPVALVAKTHWRKSTQNTAQAAMRGMHDIDPFVYEEIVHSKQPVLNKDQSFLLAKQWMKIARSAAIMNKEINIAPVLHNIQMEFAQKESSFSTEIKRSLSPPPVPKSMPLKLLPPLKK